MSPGTPKRATQFSRKALAHVSAEMSAIGTASIHLVKRSTIVSKYLMPLDSGSGPTRSRWSEPNLLSGRSQRTTGADTCMVTFASWQAWQVLHQFLMSVLNFGQTNLSATALMVGLGPAWERSCTRSNTFFRHARGTSGRRFPVETSHKIECIRHYKAWAVFFRPEGIHRNSKRPNGVIITVLAISPPAICI